MNDVARRALADWRAHLQGLYSLFGTGEDPAQETVAATWASCQSAFERFREQHEAGGGGAFDASLHGEIQEVRRLHAALSSQVARHREELSQDLFKLSRLKGKLSGQASTSSTGRSCDITG